MSELLTDVAPAEKGGFLTVDATAAALGASRSYVNVLSDAGKLGQIVLHNQMRRYISRAAVELYLADRQREYLGTVSPREVGIEIGRYSRT